MTVELVVLVLGVVLGLPQPPPPQAPTGVAECDRFVALVRACLPKMCEDEGILREAELGFALETIAAAIKLNGRAAAAESCGRDVAAELREDLYACHAESPSAATRVEASATGDAVLLRFSSPALAGESGADVAIAEPLAEPAAVFRVTSTQGTFVLDTRSAPPLAPAAGPLRLAPDTPYCYTIATSSDDPSRRRVLRKGVVLTRGRADQAAGTVER